jgi:hypothetical protein
MALPNTFGVGVEGGNENNHVENSAEFGDPLGLGPSFIARRSGPNAGPLDNIFDSGDLERIFGNINFGPNTPDLSLGGRGRGQLDQAGMFEALMQSGRFGGFRGFRAGTNNGTGTLNARIGGTGTDGGPSGTSGTGGTQSGPTTISGGPTVPENNNTTTTPNPAGGGAFSGLDGLAGGGGDLGALFASLLNGGMDPALLQREVSGINQRGAASQRAADADFARRGMIGSRFNPALNASIRESTSSRARGAEVDFRNENENRRRQDVALLLNLMGIQTDRLNLEQNQSQFNTNRRDRRDASNDELISSGVGFGLSILDRWIQNRQNRNSGSNNDSGNAFTFDDNTRDSGFGGDEGGVFGF